MSLFRQRLRDWSHSLRSNNRHTTTSSGTKNGPRSFEGGDDGTKSVLQPSLRPDGSIYSTGRHDGFAVPFETSSDEDRPSNDKLIILTSGCTKDLDTLSASVYVSPDAVTPTDLRTTAYREAVQSLKKASDREIIQEQTVDQLFRKLEEMSDEENRHSTFEKGMQHLRNRRGLLQTLGLGLDLASPVTSIEPNTSAVFGVLRGVITVAITFAAADIEFASRIEDMLEQIEYIEGCDTLSQQTDIKDVHKALVQVYIKLIEFYLEAYRLLSEKGLKFVMKTLLQTQLPKIVEEFLKKADILQKTIQKATLELIGKVERVSYDQEISEWLSSNNLSQQSRYYSSLQDICADEACEFLLAEPDLVAWYGASRSEQLVLLGDMGSGKTMVMTFLIDELRRRSAKQLRKPKVCYYYCRDDESGSADRIFSCLILSFLEQLPGLKKSFYKWFKQAKSAGIDPASDQKRLKEFLLRLLESTGHPVFFVIDGLDECDRGSRAILLDFFRETSQKTLQHKTILSSRPQQEILDQVSDICTISVVRDATRDGIIVEKTVEKQLPYLSKAVRTVIITELSHQAKGSAIWTKMIIQLIQVRRIRALAPMQDFLSNLPLPAQLSELYDIIFARCTEDDPENVEIASTALRILATVRRPLSILELAWATMTGTINLEENTVTQLGRTVDHERVLSLIHPFITQLDFNDMKAPQVQLTHQSIKEFIVANPANWPCFQGLATMIATSPTSLNDRPSSSLEALLLSLCVRYLNLDEIDKNPIFSTTELAIEALPQDINLFDDEPLPEHNLPGTWETWESWEASMIRYDPVKRGFGEFFTYASTYWIQHFGAATTCPPPKLSVIENLCRAGSMRLYNWTQQNRRPDCGIVPRFEFDSTQYDPLGVTSIYGPEILFKEMIKNADLSGPNYLHDSVQEAADQILQWGDLSRIKMLLDSDHGYHLLNLGFFRLIIERRSSRVYPCGSWDPLYEHVDYALNTMTTEHWGQKLLCVAAGAGCMPIVERLVMKAQGNDELQHELMEGYLDEDHHQNALRKAVRIGHKEMCHLLVYTGGLDPRSAVVQDANGQIALKDRTHQNEENGQDILSILCAEIDQ